MKALKFEQQLFHLYKFENPRLEECDSNLRFFARDFQEYLNPHQTETKVLLDCSQHKFIMI